MQLSIISPVYKAEKIVEELVLQTIAAIEPLGLEFEIILVEDGGPDNSWEQISIICEKDKRIKGIKLSRNFGQHYAITAGLEASKGEWVVVMDCDLQDNPLYIPQMLALAQKNEHDLIFTQKNTRKHSLFKNITAKIFFSVFNYLSDNQSGSDNVGGFSLLNRKVVDAFLMVKDSHRHYLMILRWLGFDAGYMTIEHNERFEGRSSYTFSKLIQHAIDGITSQSDKLLRLSISIGFLFVAMFFVYSLYVLIQYFWNGAYPGWTSMVLLIMLSTGLILMAIGILGVYIGKIFEQVKERPLYIIQKKINL